MKDMRKEMQNEFAKRLKECRKAAGLTQAELAKKANMAPSVIARYETAGSLPRPETVERLAAALDVIPEALTSYSVEPYTKHRVYVGIIIEALSAEQSMQAIYEIKKVKNVKNVKVIENERVK